MKIQDLESMERPREKMESLGARNLSNAELLALLLRTGTVKSNVVETARELLNAAGGSLVRLSAMTSQQMRRVNGIGRAKAVEVMAVMEIGRRLSREQDSSKSDVVDNACIAAEILKELYTTDTREECWCLYLKRNRRVVGSAKISEGGETLTEINIKTIVRQALDAAASAVILSHNHPSGDPRPSVADIKMTKRLQQALETFDMALMDHIIVSDGGFYSFSDETVFHI